MNYTWNVTRTTTDKLEGELNDFDWDIHQIQFIGGRDWVIIARIEDEELQIELEEEDLMVTPVQVAGQAVSQGPRGVKITHRPTGITVTATDEKSQLLNKAYALQLLRLKIADHNRY